MSVPNIFTILLVAFSITACVESRNDTPNEQAEETPSVTEEVGEVLPYKEKYPSGALKIEGQLMNGKRHGLWVAYYEDGVRWSENNFKAGEKHGTTVTFYPTGLLRFQGEYAQGEPAGQWTFYDENGKKVDERIY